MIDTVQPLFVNGQGYIVSKWQLRQDQGENMRRIKDSLTMILIIGVTIAATVETANASVICKKDGRFWYPENEKAIKIAKMLKVKTCNGKRFKAVLKELNVTSNVVGGTKRLSVEEVTRAMRVKL